MTASIARKRSDTWQERALIDAVRFINWRLTDHQRCYELQNPPAVTRAAPKQAARVARRAGRRFIVCFAWDPKTLEQRMDRNAWTGIWQSARDRILRQCVPNVGSSRWQYAELPVTVRGVDNTGVAFVYADSDVDMQSVTDHIIRAAQTGQWWYSTGRVL